MGNGSTRTIRIIDETLREGMQYRGVMFSLEQRLKILEFQEKLNIDICQAGYPSAHALEKETVAALAAYAREKKYRIRIAAMGRATLHDAEVLLSTGVRDLHFHVHIKNNLSSDALDSTLNTLLQTVEFVKSQAPRARLSIALLDIGRSGPAILDRAADTLDRPDIDILSLPDTSGIMAPNQVFEKISRICSRLSHSTVSVHCHNDFGMASANTVMGIFAGAGILEATALGIGERNGPADLYTTAWHLQNQGIAMGMNTDDTDTFRAYYTFVDQVVCEQTGVHLLTANTPVFGDAVKTHVAGTHAGGEYGAASEETFYLNVLCGNHLVKKYLKHHAIDCPPNHLNRLTREIKTRSIRQNRALSRSDVLKLIASLPG